MPEDVTRRNKLVQSFSVPKDVSRELAQDAEEATDVFAERKSDGSVIGSVDERRATKRQRQFDVIKEKMDRLEGNQASDALGDDITGGINEKSLEIRHRRDRTPTRRERNENRDRTPTRNEIRESTPTRSEVRDRTPSVADKDCIRRGRKRRLSDGENDGGRADDVEDTKERSGMVRHETKDIPIVMGIPLTRENLDRLLPPSFKIVPFPDDYKPLDNLPPDISKFESFASTSSKLLALSDNSLVEQEKFDPKLIYNLPDMKDLQTFTELDFKIFGKLTTLKAKNIPALPPAEQLEIKCMKLILKIKNGTTNARKLAMRSLTDSSPTFGPELIFNIVLPLLSDPQLDEQGRHLLIKIITRVMFKLGDSIRPFTEKILIVTMPLLNDDNSMVRTEGRDVISKLTKVVGLYTMLTVLRPDLNNEDDYVRNMVAKAFAVIASSLGIQTLVPFLKAICHSKKDWVIRQTGLKIIQQISVLMGSAVLPYLNQLVRCIITNLEYEVPNIRIAAASAVSSLADASFPYGFESFEVLLKPLWKGLKIHKGKALAQFIRALGNLVPLMNAENASYYSFELLKIMRRECASVDDDMKRAILTIFEKICKPDLVEKRLIVESNIIEPFFKNFWARRIAIDKKFKNLCINACYALSLTIGSEEVILSILPSLKDESEPFRRMALEVSDRVLESLGSFDLDDKTITRLLNGLLYCFQHQTLDNKALNLIVLNGFANILNNLGIRSKEHIMPIISVLLYRLKNKDVGIREQAADFIARICGVLKICKEEDLLIRLGTILYESLGEVYPDVLGSILNALRCVILAVEKIELLNPPISQILSTLTPILKNRHEKVQEMNIPLIGDIAIRAQEYISHKEWMRISFELLEMLKAYKKSIRKSANKTFGLIAKVIGPADLLVVLLNNLKNQERQLRVCTAVALGIVADVCLPYTVLPALMNEYRYPDKNVQNGVLKALTFMFEYIGEVGSDYIYASTPLLLDALTDRDLVHRQIASSVVTNMALGSYGQGYEDAFINLLNLIWPNIFETSPHVITQVMDSIDSLGIVLGSGILLNYIWIGLFHPARKVRECYWKVFNNLYITQGHTMVQYYPRFEEVGPEPSSIQAEESTKESYTSFLIEELDLWI